METEMKPCQSPGKLTMAEPTRLPASLCRPLGLVHALSQPDRRLDFTPLFDVLLIVVLLSLLGSRFLFPPGVALDLPRVSGDLLAGSPTSAVLTVHTDDMLFFKGRHFTRDALERHMLTGGAAAMGDDAVLLINVGRGVSVETLLKLAQIAREAGYLQVQIAAGREYQDGLFSSPPPRP